MFRHPAAQRRLLVERPVEEPAARFEAKPAFPDQLVEIGRWRSRPIERGQDVAVDRSREFRSDEIGVLQRPQHRETRAEAGLYDVVDGASIAHALGHQGDRLAPERVLQAIADKAGDILLHLDRRLADAAQQPERRRDRGLRRIGGANDLDERHEIRRIPPVSPERALLALDLGHDARDRNHGSVGRENRICGRRRLDARE